MLDCRSPSDGCSSIDRLRGATIISPCEYVDLLGGGDFGGGDLGGGGDFGGGILASVSSLSLRLISKYSADITLASPRAPNRVSMEKQLRNAGFCGLSASGSTFRFVPGGQIRRVPNLHRISLVVFSRFQGCGSQIQIQLGLDGLKLTGANYTPSEISRLCMIVWIEFGG